MTRDWTELRALVAGDIVLESDLAAIRNNLNLLKWQISNHYVLWLRSSIDSNGSISSTSYVNQTGMSVFSVFPKGLAEDADVYFEANMNPPGGQTSYGRVAVNGSGIAASEISSNTTAIVRSAEFGANLVTESLVTISVEIRVSGGTGGLSYPRLVIYPKGLN